MNDLKSISRRWGWGQGPMVFGPYNESARGTFILILNESRQKKKKSALKASGV